MGQLYYGQRNQGRNIHHIAPLLPRPLSHVSSPADSVELPLDDRADYTRIQVLWSRGFKGIIARDLEGLLMGLSNRYKLCLIILTFNFKAVKILALI
jgi:hypothetical protein